MDFFLLNLEDGTNTIVNKKYIVKVAPKEADDNSFMNGAKIHLDQGAIGFSLYIDGDEAKRFNDWLLSEDS